MWVIKYKAYNQTDAWIYFVSKKYLVMHRLSTRTQHPAVGRLSVRKTRRSGREGQHLVWQLLACLVSFWKGCTMCSCVGGKPGEARKGWFMAG